MPDLLSIDLLAPMMGEVTAPLQRYHWPEDGLWYNAANYPEENWQRYLAENDRSLPRAVLFTWQAPEVVFPPQTLRYDLCLSLSLDFQNARVLRGLKEPRAEVTNLQVGKQYYWKVSAWIGASPQSVAQSGLGSFITHATPPRWIEAPGITNVRDLGGWPLPGGKRVRQGMIFRGSEMNSHCKINDAGCKVLMEDLGIRTDIDLRGLGEEAAAVLDLTQVDYFNIPLVAYDMIASPTYTNRYRMVFQLLAQPARYPIYMHCWGGADRTGTLAFLLLALLGVSLEDLSTDYELTSMSIWGERSRRSSDFQELLQTLVLFGEDGSTLQSQVEYYLRVIGVTQQEMMAITALLVE